MSVTTRRTALAMLGLASATAVGAETFTEPPEKPGDVQTGVGTYNKERIAVAFERLADEIRKGAVSTCELQLKAVLSPDRFADLHELKLEFLYHPEKSAV